MHRVPVAHQRDGQQRQGDDDDPCALERVDVRTVLAVRSIRFAVGGGHDRIVALPGSPVNRVTNLKNAPAGDERKTP